MVNPIGLIALSLPSRPNQALVLSLLQRDSLRFWRQL